MKRLISMLMALLVAVSALGGLAIPAAADESYTATDPYVLNFSGQKIEGYEDFDNKRLYASPYRTDIYVTQNGALANWNWCSGSVLNMINTAKLKEGGVGAYASIGVYCVDAITGGVEGYRYRRVNLEDSGYFTDATAGRLRAIIMAAFPHQTDMAALAAAVNAWDARNGDLYADVQQMNYAEVISATQSVIWALTNEGKLGDPVYAGYAPNGFDDAEIVYPASMDFPVSDYTANNINALAAYLNDLEPMAPRDTVLTESAIRNTTLTYTKAEDSTYTATVTATVTAAVDDGDALTLTAVCGEKVSDPQAIVDGTNTYTVTFTGLADAAEAVTVNIDGHQDASDVFLFDPLNGRDASQSMAGYDSSTLPVHAEATVAPRILELTKIDEVKTTVTGEDGTVTEKFEKIPLQNIQFEIYFVCAMDDFVSGKVTFADAPNVSEGELAKYVTDANKVGTITTDEEGFASYNFTAHNRPDGIYIIKELHNKYTEKPMAPFYLAVPFTDSDGNVVTTICMEPKNDAKGEDIEIEKDVTGIDNEHDTYDMGQNHTWIIQSSVPTGIADGLKYEITDTLDHRLTLVSVDRVAVARDSGTFGDSEVDGYEKDENETPAFAETVVLELGTDYVVTVNTAQVEDRSVDRFAVSLTADGMRKVAEAVENDGDEALDYGDYEVRVYFTAYINTNADLGVEIPNQAHIDYTNNLGLNYAADSDIPDVCTGGVEIRKVDTAGNVLAGAKFVLARPAAAGETSDAAITVDGAEIDVVYADFYASADKSGEKIYEVTTGEDGVALFYGLAYGTYYLIETEAPAGYNELLAPVAVEINAESHLEGNAYRIVNTKGFELPDTGGEGTMLFAVSGGVIIAAALVLLVMPKKKKA